MTNRRLIKASFLGLILRVPKETPPSPCLWRISNGFFTRGLYSLTIRPPHSLPTARRGASPGSVLVFLGALVISSIGDGGYARGENQIFSLQSSDMASSTAASRPASENLRRVNFKEAIKLALARNPNALVAQTDIQRAEALVRQALAGFLPTLTSNMTYTRLDSDRVRNASPTETMVVASANSLNINSVLNIPIVYAQRWNQWWRARDTLASMRASTAEARRQVAIATGRAYLAVLAQHRVIEVAERARDNAQAHLDYARKRFSAGADNRLTVVKSAQEVATDEAQVQSAYGNLAKTREALGILIGADQPIDINEEVNLVGQPPDIKKAMQQLRNRLDIKAYEASLAAAQNAVNAYWADFMPYLTGTFQPFYQNPASFSMPTTGWQALLMLTIPLYDGGLRYGQQRERRALLQAAQIKVSGVLRQARADVRTTYAVLKQADRALDAARQAAQFGEQAYQMADQAFKAGATTNLEVIDAARQARDAETAAVIAEDNARQARLDLLIAIGKFP